MLFTFCLTASLALAWQPGGHQSPEPISENTKTQQWRFGVSLTAKGAAGKNVSATLPFPMDWPEQKVKIVREQVSAGAKLAYKPAAGGWARQLVLTVANLPAGQERQAVVVVEVERTALAHPSDTAGLVAPKAAKLKPDVRAYLDPSQEIESDHATIRAKAKELTANQTGAWQQVEALYDWVRAHIKDRNSPDKGALKAIEKGAGDRVEISSAFVALCRASGVPARLVWVPRHCYPEFYLEDANGEGRWYPCAATGKREFGGLAEYRPILSKGDKFPAAAGKGKTERFMAENVTGFGGTPTAKFIREVLTKDE